MKVGVEGNHTVGFESRGILKTLDLARELGLGGVLVKTVLHISPSLDEGELKEARAHADELGLYLECGIGRVNPFNTAEAPSIRALGGGDYRRAIELMIRAARSIDCTELWAETATSADKDMYSGRFSVDRFRTDVSWNDQLVATQKFVQSFTPLLRDLGSRIDLETHEEITSFEVVRMVEAVGPEVMGITFDSGNILLRCEDPVAAARRVAPYTHLTHIKEAALFFNEEGLFRQIPAVGKGAINWKAVLAILGEYSPNLHLSLEDGKGLGGISIYDPAWQALHPDLSVGELAEIIRLARMCETKVAAGEWPDPYQYEAIPFEDQWIDRLKESSQFLNETLKSIGLDEK